MKYTYRFIGGPIGGTQWDDKDEFFGVVHVQAEGKQHRYEQVSMSGADPNRAVCTMQYKGKESMARLPADLFQQVAGNKLAFDIARAVQELHVRCAAIGVSQEEADALYSEITKRPDQNLSAIECINKTWQEILQREMDKPVDKTKRKQYTIKDGRLIELPRPSTN